jgi:prepilin-type N-terminal cleavage/methylation domain-containing protein
MHKGVWSETMRAKCFCNTKKGFSLIEVIIALAILMIVVLGLISSYYSYYRNMTDLRIKTTGQNLAQLQLEDIQNLAVSVLGNMIYDPMNPGYQPNYPPKDTSVSPYSVYNSGKINGEFKIEGLTAIPTTTPSDLFLPVSIEVAPDNSVGPYTLTLYAETFPNYWKRIVITDKTTSLDQEHKIFGIEVTVYWDVNGVEKSITIIGEKSYARSS